MKKYLLVFLLLLSGPTVFSQVYNNGAIIVKPNENVYIQGDYVNQPGGRINLSGTVHLQGNWYNYDNTANIVTNPVNGLLRFVGQTQQTNGGSQYTKFTNVELNNSLGLQLLKDAEIRQTFLFTSGKVFTNNNFLVISTTDNNAIIGHDVARYVVGNLRRYVSGFAPYDLPVGTSAYYELAVIKFNSMSGIQFINTNFVQSPEAPPPPYPSPDGVYVYPDVMNPVPDPLSNLMSEYSYITEFLNYGYWVTYPDNAGSANFKMTLTSRGHTNGGPIPGNHALIRRDNTNSLWKAQGIYAFNSQIGSMNYPITVNMDQMTGFSHFIIGRTLESLGPLAIVLESFEVSCNNGIAVITWTTSNESNNAYFTVQKSYDLAEWMNIAKVPGQQFSNGEITYNVSDSSLSGSPAYYRLKQTDMDSTVKIYDHQWLRYADCANNKYDWVRIYTSPDNLINLNFYSETESAYLVSVYDPMGRLLFKQDGVANKGINRDILRLPPTAAGVLLIDFKTNKNRFTQKLILSR